MSYYTQAQVEQILDNLFQSTLKAQKAQQYDIEGAEISTRVKRQKLEDLRNGIEYWEGIRQEIIDSASGPYLTELTPTEM